MSKWLTYFPRENTHETRTAHKHRTQWRTAIPTMLCNKQFEQHVVVENNKEIQTRITDSAGNVNGLSNAILNNSNGFFFSDYSHDMWHQRSMIYIMFIWKNRTVKSRTHFLICHYGTYAGIHLLYIVRKLFRLHMHLWLSYSYDIIIMWWILSRK